MRIPRVVMVTFGFIAAIIIGCCAARYFSDTLQTLLSVIGYWTVIHITLVMEEHFIFRRGWNGYDFDAWNSTANCHLDGLPSELSASGFWVRLLV
jgi:purine-cytosine permease-like protein